MTAERNLAYQNERLAFTRILSPYDGLVVRRDRDPGGVVVPASALLQLIATGETILRPAVPRQELREGRRVQARKAASNPGESKP